MFAVIMDDQFLFEIPFLAESTVDSEETQPRKGWRASLTIEKELELT